jgi:flagellar protein FlgJ
MLRMLRPALSAATIVVCATAPTLVAAAPAQAAARAGTVRVSGALTVRTGPTTSATAVGTLRNGAKIKISCAVTGQRIKGNVRTTTRWDRLTNGRYVSHAYVRTTATIPTCAPTTVPGTVRSADGPVNLRTGPTTAFGVQGSAASGARLTLACAIAGESVTGTVRTTTQWDRLADGRYISHAYVASPTLPRCPGAAPTPPPTMTNAQFIASAVPGAQQGWREYGVPASVTIAQAILESGWGRSALSATDRNYFGIKCFGDPGPIAAGCHTYQTFECTKAGTCFTTSASFRTYAKVADSYRDHGHFLRTNSRYRPAFAYTRDADEFLRQIAKAGYATDPKYVDKVKGLMRSHDLYQYDIYR